MSAEDLPDELIAEILQYLPGTEVVHCRKVCRRWRDAIDNFPDSFWQRICEREGDDYSMAHSKYGLSWKSTYKALNSWNRLEKIPIKTRHTNHTSINAFQVLPNGILALLKNLRHPNESLHNNYSDTVIYFDLEKNQEINRDEYGCLFKKYRENEYFKVIQKRNSSISIITKADKKRYKVPLKDERLKFTIINDEVYSYAYDTIALTKIAEVDGKMVLKTELLPTMDCNHVVAIAKKNGVLYIMGPNVYRFDAIRAFKDNKYFSVSNKEIPLEKLSNYGLSWKTPQVFEHLLLSAIFENITKSISYSTMYGHGGVFIGGSKYRREIEVINAHRVLKFQDLLEEKAQLAVLNVGDIGLTQLDIVETENQHKILVLVERKLCILEIPHYSSSYKRKNNRFSSKMPFCPVQ